MGVCNKSKHSESGTATNKTCQSVLGVVKLLSSPVDMSAMQER